MASEPRIVKGLRKLRPQVEMQRPQGRKARALAPEQKRNVHPVWDDDARDNGCAINKRLRMLGVKR